MSEDKQNEPFGQIAVRLGFCTQKDVDDALREQERLRDEEDDHKLIGMILLENRVLSTAQLIQILQYYDHSARVPEMGEEPAQGDSPAP